MFRNFQKFVICLLLSHLTIGIAQAQNSSKTVMIGQTTGLTGPVAGAVKEINVGAMLAIDEYNKSNSPKIELITLDDGFDAKRAAENADVLAKEKQVLALLLSRGTSQTEALLPVLAKHKMALIAPSTGALSLHKPVNPYVFNVRSTYRGEASQTIGQLNNMQLKKIGVVYRDDGFGKDGLEGALEGFKAINATPLFVLKVDKTKADFTESIATIRSLQPKALLIIEAPGTVARAVREIRQAKLEVQIATLSNCASNSFISDMGAVAAGVMVSQVFPSTRGFSYNLITTATNLAKGKQIAQLTPAMLEGYTAAVVLIEAVKGIKNAPVTRERLLASLNKININLGNSLTINFTPTDHTGLSFSDLSIINSSGQFVF
jgi:branched-chain amino acid transport system substrate-binding protein